MKKHLTLFLFALVFSSLGSLGAFAQVPVAIDTPLVNQYLEDSNMPRNASWWGLLERQLAYSVDKTPDAMNSTELQNLIFFATVHGDKMKLQDAAPRLLAVYESHPDEQFRIMAVAALDALGDGSTMRRLRQLVEQEPSTRVRRVTNAAINKHLSQK